MKKATNILKTVALLTGVLILSAFALVTTPANSSDEVVASASTSTELLALNTADFEGKCGEGKEEEKAEGKKESEKGAAKKSEKTEKSEKTKREESKEEGEENKEEGAKSEESEAKCGEGKCGGQ